MEFDLQRTVLEGYQPVLDTVLTQEETLESIVPDAYPDISRIICASGTGFLTLKQAGEGSAKVCGSLRVTVLYVPEGERTPRALGLELPFQCVGDHPQITQECQIHSAVLSVSADARLMNPRKLFVRAELRSRLAVYARESREVVCDLAAEGEGTVQKQLVTRQEHAIQAVLEKPFLFSDTLRQSASRPPMEELLWVGAQPGALDAKYIGKKLVCKGEVVLTVLYRSGEELVPARFELPYSQVLDLEGMYEEGEPDMALALKSADCHLRDGELDVALEALIQAALWSCREVTLLSDVYSTAAPLDVERGGKSLCTMSQRHTRRESARKFCESGIPARQVLCCASSLSPLTGQRQEGGIAYTADALVEILYLSEDNALCAVSYPIPVSCLAEAPEGHACVCHCQPVGEITAVPVTGGLEVRLEVEFSWRLTRGESVPCVTQVRRGLAAGESGPRPSVIVRMVGRDETLWDIAKACGSTVEDICAANDLPGETPIPGALLLIPTRR